MRVAILELKNQFNFLNYLNNSFIDRSQIGWFLPKSL